MTGNGKVLKMSNYSIKVKDLKKYFGEVRAVDGINFRVEAGTIFGMLGPNGAGKTTTIETLVGLNERDSGDIDILGLDPDRDLQELNKKIGVQLQSPSLFPRLTVKEIMNLFASFYPDPRPVKDVIVKIGLQNKENTRVKTLSGGQQHRLAVGLAMLSNGRIIFLDEPTTGLDPQARRQLWEVIEGLKRQGVTVFLTTHYMEEAEQLCDKLVIIDRGKLIARGSPGELINKYFRERAVEFPDPGFNEREKEALEGLEIAESINYEEKDQHIILYTREIEKTMRELMAYARETKKSIDDVIIRRATLEDVFLKLTGRGME